MSKTIASYQNSDRRNAAIDAFSAASRPERELLTVLALLSANISGSLLPAGSSLESLRKTLRDLSDAALYEQYERCLPARQQLTSHGLARWLLTQPDVPVSRNGEDGVEAVMVAERDEDGIFLY